MATYLRCGGILKLALYHKLTAESTVKTLVNWQRLTKFRERSLIVSMACASLISTLGTTNIKLVDPDRRLTPSVNAWMLFTHKGILLRRCSTSIHSIILWVFTVASANIPIKLDNTGSRIDMQTHAGSSSICHWLRFDRATAVSLASFFFGAQCEITRKTYLLYTIT